MGMEPPRDAVILGVSGLRGPQEMAAARDAILRCDPAAEVWTDLAAGRIAVRSGVPEGALVQALRAAGYPAQVQARPPGRRGTVGGIFGRILFYAVAGGALGLAGGVLLGMANSLFNPSCVSGGSGNCAIGIGVFGALFGAIGIPLGALAGLVHGLVRLGR